MARVTIGRGRARLSAAEEKRLWRNFLRAWLASEAVWIGICIAGVIVLVAR
jgi:hypothetical protein